MFSSETVPRSLTVAAVVAAVTTLAGCDGTSVDEPTSSASGTVSASASPSPSAEVPGTSQSPSASPTVTEAGDESDGSDGGDSGASYIEMTLEGVDVDDGLGEMRITTLVPGVLSDTGLCTATLTSGDDVVEVQKPAIFNVDRTECLAMTFALSEVAGQTWDVAVTYVDGDLVAVYEGSWDGTAW